MHVAQPTGRGALTWPPAEVRQVAGTFLSLADERAPGPAAVADTLRGVHARIAEVFSWPPFDGFHLTWEDLARSPYDCPDLPCTLAGAFGEEERLDVNPVTWHELARHGVTVHGPVLAELDIWTDRAALRRYTRDNLGSYWREQAEALRRFPAEAGGARSSPWR